MALARASAKAVRKLNGAAGERDRGQLVRISSTAGPYVLEVARHIERQLDLGLTSRRAAENLEGCGVVTG